MVSAEAVTVVENGLSEQGWRRVHLLSAREADVRAAWEAQLRAVPWESADAVHTQVYEEAGIWHCLVLWPLRGEVVKMVWPTSRDVGTSLSGLDNHSARGPLPSEDRIILWVLTGKDRPVSEVVRQTAWYHLAYFDEYPDTAWVGLRMAKLDGREVRGPASHDAGTALMDHDGPSACGLGVIRICAAHWMPEMGIGVGLASVS